MTPIKQYASATVLISHSFMHTTGSNPANALSYTLGEVERVRAQAAVGREGKGRDKSGANQQLSR